MRTILKAYYKNSDVVAYHKYESKFISDHVLIYEETFDENGKLLTFKDATGYSSKFTRDQKGNEIAYKNSTGLYKVKGNRVSKEEYEAFINQLNSTNIDGEEVEIKGRKYKLKLIK